MMTMSRDMEGKVALVTGAASGIGRATALAFARAGTKVVVADIAVEGGQATVATIKKNGGQAVFIRTDVSQESEVEALVRQTIETYGRLDYAHNNAGIEGTADTASEEIWHQIMNVNLMGVWLCLKHEIPHMVKQGKGAIVNTSSVAGLIATGGGMNAYAPSKAGVIQLTRDAALAYAKAGVRVNAVCPGVIKTDMIQRVVDEHPSMQDYLANRAPMGRMGEPHEIAQVVWLCSDESSYITGVALAVDGGWTVQ
jgi:NAD(P)-dependent dehydrogenase (short-subunit alcohol dehydrogenase family)